MQAAANYGATPGDWAHFDLVLGVGADLLPVVSNPKAAISPLSKMAALGKTPSRYNNQRQVAGIAEWTSYSADDADLAKWAKEPDYGICVQTRNIRAIDVDVEDPTQAKEIYELLEGLVLHSLPARRRAGSSKFLCPVTLPNGTDYVKRVIKTAHGIIEFLATGQQFIAVGTHPSGARYDWSDGGVGGDGLPVSVPGLTAEQFEALWSTLEARFGVEPSKTASTVSKAAKLSDAVAKDETAVALYENNKVLSAERDGRLHITCPFEEEHTSESAESATTYWPANTGGFAKGHFHCLHAHCSERTDHDFLSALGIGPDMADDYEVIAAAELAPTVTPTSTSNRYTFVNSKEFSAGKPMGWWVKGLLPKADLAVVYGPPAAGKSFWVLDLVMAIAKGQDWCGLKTHRGRVFYVVAEGANGFRNRIQAHEIHHGLDDADDIKVLADVPNLTKREDVIDLGNAINRMGGADLLVYDTFARGTSGADENSAKDVGVAVEHCRALSKATGAMVLLVHHSGKDASKGARGSNALLGAVDAEIEITRFDDNRTATVKKLKDGSDHEQYGFKLKTIALGMDEDGDEITSCVVEHGAVASRPKRVKKLGEHEERLLHVLADVTSLGGVGPVGDVLKEAFIAATALVPGAKDRRTDQYGRAFRSLDSAGKIAVVDGRVVIVSQE